MQRIPLTLTWLVAISQIATAQVHQAETPESRWVGIRYDRAPPGVTVIEGAWLEEVNGVGYALHRVSVAGATMLWLERRLPQDSDAAWEIVSVLSLPSLARDESAAFGSTVCMLNDEFDLELVAVVQDDLQQEVLTEVRGAWRANRRRHAFEEIATTGVSCLNRSYGIFTTFIEDEATLDCNPLELYRGDTLQLRMATPHGGYLAILDPAGTTYFVVYPNPNPGQPSVLPPSAFRLLDNLALITDRIQGAPRVHGRDRNELIFSQSGTYEVRLGENLESDAGHTVYVCRVAYVHERQP